MWCITTQQNLMTRTHTLSLLGWFSLLTHLFHCAQMLLSAYPPSEINETLLFPVHFFRGIDNKTYYMVDTSAYEQLLNYSGCGNTINANNPVTTQLIVDSLRHWVEEYHVDGFRFDLASCLCRGVNSSI